MLRSAFKILLTGENNLTYVVGGEGIALIGLNLEETDASGNPSLGNTGSVWMQDVNDQNGLSLCHGLLRNGQLSGFGLMPLAPGDKIKARLWHSVAGHIAKLNILTMPVDKKYPLQTTWQQSAPALATYLAGKLRTVKVDGAAVDIAVELQPAASKAWQVMECWATHDDGVNRTLYWAYWDGIANLEKLPGIAVAANVPVYLQALNNTYPTLCSPLIVNYEIFPVIHADALAAGKALHLRAIVMEYSE